MENRISFLADNLVLEGLLHRVPGDKGVIITHPHSLYGGDMYNPVVETVSRVCAAKGYSTLRFNFRGVGASQGVFDNGCGEERDVYGAIDFFRNSGVHIVHLVGYSFGARVLAGLDALPGEVVAETYIAPPVAFMDFSGVGRRAKLRLVIAGEQDEIGPPEHIRKYMPSWNGKARLMVVKDADHFFSTTMTKLEEVLLNQMENIAHDG